MKSTSFHLLLAFVAIATVGTACLVGGGGGGGGSESPGCGDPGEYCDHDSDCCQSGHNYGQIYIASDGACHAVCYHGDDCNSGCCGELQGSSYGACASPGRCM